MKRQIILLIILIICAIILLAACDTLLENFQQTDSQSATLTAMVTPTSIPPTLDLKGNEVQEVNAESLEVVCISILEDRLHGGIMEWSENAPLFAYVAPANRYWGWFSGDAVVLNLSDEAKVPDEFGNIPAGLAPSEMSTTDLHVFGDFAFSPDNSKLAFTALRQSEKLYTVMMVSLDSGMKDVIDLFPDALAETDEYASDKSVIKWLDNNTLQAASSCGLDCERIYNINVKSGSLSPQEEVRKHGHTGREQPNHVIDYDERNYPVMNNANWSPDEQFVFYTDSRYQSWIIRESSKQQYQLPIDGRDLIQTLWSSDSRFLAVRYEDKIEIYEIG